jgi:VWFA-related protein
MAFTRHARTCVIWATAAGIALVLFASEWHLNAQTSGARKFYFSVLDREGNPVTDLTPAEVEVREGGRPQEFTLAQPAATPLRVALIVADGGTGAYQAAATTFMNKLMKGAEFKVVAVTEQAETLTSYTSSVPELSGAVQRLAKRTARRMGAQVMEAISESIADVAADGKRPVIVVMRLGGEPPTTLRANVVRDALRKSGARLHVISPVGGGGAGRGGMGVTRSQGDSQGETDLSNMVVLNQVLDDGSRESGGRHDQVAATTVLKTLEQLGNELMSQYEVSYTLPAGTKPSDRLQISTKRRDVRVFAPSRIPN